jgi:small subunit ribosomal protein S4
MRYTWPKFKLCRREGLNLFWSAKYDVKKRRSAPGQHGANVARLSEYGKLLRNKQVLKRMFCLSEKQFARLVTIIAAKYAKNKWIAHDLAVNQFLLTRLDSIIYYAWVAKTMMQARQMITHGHFMLNGKKHNIPSTYMQLGDALKIRDKVKISSLYQDNLSDKSRQAPIYIKLNKQDGTIELLDMPTAIFATDEKLSDVLKVIEFYARA